MARALVTGGTGFVGANLARALLRRGHEVHLLLRSAHQAWRIADIRGDLRCHAVDLRDRAALARACRDIRPDYVFHLAASGAYSWQQDVEEITAVNVNATAHLLDACRDVAAFVHAGSSAEYGFQDHAPAESERLEPNSLYAATKAAATHLCRAAALHDGRRIITLRLYSVYGPYEEPRRLVPALLVHGLAGRFPPLVAPDTARDFIFIDDVCDAFWHAATHPQADPAGFYNIGSGLQTTLRQAVDAARQLFVIPAEPRWGDMPPRRWDTSCWVSNPALAAAHLDWRASTSFPDGLARTRDWLIADPARLHHYQAALAADSPGAPG